MKRFLAMFLLIGALSGLLGQEAAFASGVRAPMTEANADKISADCMEMMQKQQPDPAKQPCKGLTLDCIAAMGCVAPLVLGEPATPMVVPQAHAPPAFWPAITVLAGNDVPPEPHPPTILG